jgi:pimeloyl-CoA synthetase
MLPEGKLAITYPPYMFIKSNHSYQIFSYREWYNPPEIALTDFIKVQNQAVRSEAVAAVVLAVNKQAELAAAVILPVKLRGKRLRMWSEQWCRLYRLSVTESESHNAMTNPHSEQRR